MCISMPDSVWTTSMQIDPRISKFVRGVDKPQTMRSASGRWDGIKLDLVHLRHCDGVGADRHRHYWDLPCDGLFRLTPIGLEWYGETDPDHTKLIKSITEELQFRINQEHRK